MHAVMRGEREAARGLPPGATLLIHAPGIYLHPIPISGSVRMHDVVNNEKWVCM